MFRTLTGLAALLGVGVALASGTASVVAAEPKVGEKAPSFSLQGSDGKTYNLNDFKGKSAVVLAWFPKAFTGGCTAECKSFRANGPAIRKFNVAYFTASVDSPETNKKFAESLGLDYPILSDPDKSTAKAYGVVHGNRAVAERWTFYIDQEGIIRAIDKAVKAGQHATDVATKLEELGIATK
jgi:thioredoxin-dependent peroxiredoxin